MGSAKLDSVRIFAPDGTRIGCILLMAVVQTCVLGDVQAAGHLWLRVHQTMGFL